MDLPVYIQQGRRGPSSKAWAKHNVPIPIKQQKADLEKALANSSDAS